MRVTVPDHEWALPVSVVDPDAVEDMGGAAWRCGRCSEPKVAHRSCWACRARGSLNVVQEVWFELDGMAGAARFCSTRDALGPKPLLCDACKDARANELASAVLLQALKGGATGPLWPRHWWVRYDEGSWPPRDCVGGDVGPKPEEA